MMRVFNPLMLRTKSDKNMSKICYEGSPYLTEMPMTDQETKNLRLFKF